MKVEVVEDWNEIEIKEVVNMADTVFDVILGNLIFLNVQEDTIPLVLKIGVQFQMH